MSPLLRRSSILCEYPQGFSSGYSGFSGLSGSLDSGLLKNLWDKVPDSIKKKIDHGTPLSPTEQEEFDIAKREANISVRPNLKGLDQINNYYHETNPVGGRNVVFRGKDEDTYEGDL